MRELSVQTLAVVARPPSHVLVRVDLGLLLLVAGVWFIRLVAGIVPGGPPANGAA